MPDAVQPGDAGGGGADLPVALDLLNRYLWEVVALAESLRTYVLASIDGRQRPPDVDAALAWAELAQAMRDDLAVRIATAEQLYGAAGLGQVADFYFWNGRFESPVASETVVYQQIVKNTRN
jgi:hypothetical protein